MITVYILSADVLSGAEAAELPFGDSERARIENIKDTTYKKESLGGLVALWRLLSERSIGLPLSIARDSSGKPYFESASALPFSISHSHGICAAALGDGTSGEVGIDVEAILDGAKADRIAERFFSDGEKKEFELAGRTADSFYSIWTAKEAAAKLDGKGLAACLGDTQTEAHVTRRMLEIGNVRIALAIACRDAEQTVQIFTNRYEEI